MALETRPGADTFEKLPKFFQESINQAVAKATEEELEKAKQRIEERKAEIIAGVVLHIQKAFDMTTANDRIVITVRTQ